MAGKPAASLALSAASKAESWGASSPATYSSTADHCSCIMRLGEDSLIDSLRSPGPSLPEEPIRLLPYDPSWPARFEQERAALEDAIGERVRRRHTSRRQHRRSRSRREADHRHPGRRPRSGGVDAHASSRWPQLGYLYAPYLADEMHWFCKPHPSSAHPPPAPRPGRLAGATATSWRSAIAFEPIPRSRRTTSP